MKNSNLMGQELGSSVQAAGQALAGPRGVSGFCLGIGHFTTSIGGANKMSFVRWRGRKRAGSAVGYRTSQLSRKAGWDWNGELTRMYHRVVDNS
ncbi:hypothetical protein WG66_009043 [Moniliophthora roreri]|nr:hypothetical protein WG66_009043 [Moniliophthora roreri]